MDAHGGTEVCYRRRRSTRRAGAAGGATWTGGDVRGRGCWRRRGDVRRIRRRRSSSRRRKRRRAQGDAGLGAAAQRTPSTPRPSRRSPIDPSHRPRRPPRRSATMVLSKKTERANDPRSGRVVADRIPRQAYSKPYVAGDGGQRSGGPTAAAAAADRHTVLIPAPATGMSAARVAFPRAGSHPRAARAASTPGARPAGRWRC